MVFAYLFYILTSTLFHKYIPGNIRKPITQLINGHLEIFLLLINIISNIWFTGHVLWWALKINWWRLLFQYNLIVVWQKQFAWKCLMFNLEISTFKVGIFWPLSAVVESNSPL